MNGLDEWIQQELVPKGYFRYMEDLVLPRKTKEDLEGLDMKIDLWFKVNRERSLNHNKTKILSLDQGILFLGHWCVQTDNPKAPPGILFKAEQ